MLVITRRIGERVLIGEGIYCTVLGVRGNQIRLGFDAPKEITILRSELEKRPIEANGIKSLFNTTAQKMKKVASF